METYRFFDGRFYPHSMQGTYGGAWPLDGVDVDEATFLEFTARPLDGKQIGVGEAGGPCWVDTPPPTAEVLQAWASAEARSYLLSTDWYVIRQQETGQEVPEGISSARAEARTRVID